jgi:hypothetical protein
MADAQKMADTLPAQAHDPSFQTPLTQQSITLEEIQ